MACWALLVFQIGRGAAAARVHGQGPPAAPQATPAVAATPSPADVPAPGEPAFEARVRDHDVELEVRGTDGQLVRAGRGVLASESGYVMTSLEVVVGGSTYAISGPLAGSHTPVTPIAVTRKGRIAVLQLASEVQRAAFGLPAPSPGRPGVLLDALPRTSVPPAVGDRVFGSSAGGVVQAGKVASIDDEADGTRILDLSFDGLPGTGLYNRRGELVAVVRSTRGKVSRRAVFVPRQMPGIWVDYFPARVGDPVVKRRMTDEAPPP